MLIITRAPYKSIQVGDDIVIKYLGLWNGQARIGIEAPPFLNIARTELLKDVAGKDTHEVAVESTRQDNATPSQTVSKSKMRQPATKPSESKPKVIYKRRRAPKKTRKR